MEKEIRFRPITDGLGFHPFSDGLPYAPVSQTPPSKSATKPVSKFSQGAGAYSAGPQIPVMPATPGKPYARTRVSVPVAPESVRKFSRPDPISETAQPLLNISEPIYGMGYLIRRVFAYAFDSALNLVLCAGALGLSLWKQGIPRDVLLSPGVFLIGVLFLVILNWALITAQEVAFGTSVGKRLLGLAVHGSTSAIFMRAFFFLPSLAFCGLGLIWALFDSNKRCWHDHIVNVQPTYLAQL